MEKGFVVRLISILLRHVFLYLPISYKLPRRLGKGSGLHNRPMAIKYSGIDSWTNHPFYILLTHFKHTRI